jgi:hypothetical protein
MLSSSTIPFEASINSRAHEHEGAIVAVYSKMKTDSFTSQLQTVLTAYNEDIVGVQGASGCTKAKVVKRKFEDHWQEDTVADADADAANTAATAATPEGEEATEGASGGEEPPPAPSPAGKNGAVKAGAARGVVGRLLGPNLKADAD